MDVNICDGGGESPLGLALWTNQFPVAQQLLDGGASIESTCRSSPGLLYLAIVREKAKAARYLLDNGADFMNKCVMCVVCVCVMCTPLRTGDNDSFLIMALRHQLEDVADRMCELGADVNQTDSEGNSPLWVALRSKQEAVAAKLVRYD